MRVLYIGPPDMCDTVVANLPSDWLVSTATSEAVVDELLPATDVILDAYMRVRLPATRLALAQSLKLVTTATTGADHIDAGYLEERGIPLLTLRGQHAFLRGITPAAEHSWLLLMACARRLRAATNAVLDGTWDRNQFPGLMLRGRTLGLVGCGRIGSWMATYARAFGMRVLAFDPGLAEFPDSVVQCDLFSLLRESDFVSLHVPLSDETRGMIGCVELEELRPGAVVINTSRGEIVDESALLRGLESGRIGAAGLDVLSGEPEVENHPLVAYARNHDNLLITPHIGGFSPDALEHVLAFSCKRIREFVDAA